MLTKIRKTAKILAMNTFALKSPDELGAGIAENMRSMRKKKKMTIKELSARSLVPYSTIKRFEHTGEISLSSLIRLAFVLDCTEDFEQLFAPRTEINSIEDIINGRV